MNSLRNAEPKKTTFITDTMILGGLKKDTIKEHIKLQNKETFTNKEDISEILDPVIENKLQPIVKITKKNNLYEKISFKPPHKNFYSTFDITPGINFIKKIFSHEKSEKLIPNLKINIPETFWIDTENFFIYNDPLNYNRLTILKNQRDPELFKSLKSIESTQYRREFNEFTKIEPLLVAKSQDTDFENSIKVEKYETAEENLLKDSGDAIFQRFIRSKGRNRDLDEYKLMKEKYINYIEDNKKNAKHLDQVDPNKEINDSEISEANIEEGNSESFVPQLNTQENVNAIVNTNYDSFSQLNDGKKKSYTRPTILRLEYKTGHNSSKKHNVGYLLINKKYMEPSINQKKKESLDKYTQLCTVNTSNPDSFDIYLMSGDALKPYEFYANEIIITLQKMFKLLLKTIVIDFIKDERGKIYFLGVKAFVPYRLKEDIKKELTVKDQLKDEKNLKKFYKTLACKLCQLSYPKSDITKLVTYKLLIQLKNNLAKRGKKTFTHITNHNVNRDYSTMCYVCDLCYTLLITEQELMEIQKSIALCNNIQIPQEEEIERKNSSPKNMNKILNEVKFVNQWRILFYFVRFYMIDFTTIAFTDDTNYKLYIKLFDQKFGIPILNDIEKFTTMDEIEINVSKIFYFFTNDTTNLKNILKKEQVDFRLVLNDNWDNPIAQCQTSCLAFFDSDSVTKSTVTVKKILNLFLTDAKFFKCQVYIGLNNDFEIPSENLPLYNYKMTGCLFLTYLDYYSYHPLPDDWLELFLPQNAGIGEYHDYKNEWMDKIIYGKRFKNNNLKINNIENLNREDTVYDPYETLVQIQDKKNLISKIKSTPIIYDKNYDDKSKKSNKHRPQTSLILSKIRNSHNNSESNGKYLFPKTDNKHIHNSVLPSIASFKTSSAKDYENNEPKYKKKTDILGIPANFTDDMLGEILGKLDTKKKRIINDSFESV